MSAQADNGRELSLSLIKAENKAIGDLLARAETGAEMEYLAVRLHHNIESMRRVVRGEQAETKCNVCGKPTIHAHECAK